MSVQSQVTSDPEWLTCHAKGRDGAHDWRRRDARRGRARGDVRHEAAGTAAALRRTPWPWATYAGAADVIVTSRRTLASAVTTVARQCMTLTAMGDTVAVVAAVDAPLVLVLGELIFNRIQFKYSFLFYLTVF